VIGTAFPRAWGGSDARQVLRIRVVEELSRVCSTAASMVTGTDLSSRAIVAGASDEFKARLLPGLCRGEKQSAFALTEPGAGSDVRGLKTMMRRVGDRYVVNGAKKFITRASTADWFVVVGRAEDDPSVFIALLVPRDAGGLEISPEVGKLGWYGVPISSLVFRKVEVPASHRMGAEGEGFSLAQDALLRARIGHAAMALGRAIGAVEIAAAYATDRGVFGKALGEHQGVQWMLADMVTQVESARALLHVTAEKYDRCPAAHRRPRLPAGLPAGALLPRRQAEPDRRRRERSAQDRDRARCGAARPDGRAQPVPATRLSGRLLNRVFRSPDTCTTR
jgi:alkylation response protein AidB-like acyl-CoA dehydrogenase